MKHKKIGSHTEKTTITMLSSSFLKKFQYTRLTLLALKRNLKSEAQDYYKTLKIINRLN